MADSSNVQNVNNLKLNSKRVFDKKKWRQQKYSTKFKVQQWEEKRKKIVEQKYRKSFPQGGATLADRNSKTESSQKISRLKEAQQAYERRKQEDLIRREEQRKVQEEKQKAIKQYQQKKAEKFRKLNQKTRKGQPLMRGRMELLQEKIEKMIAENKL